MEKPFLKIILILFIFGLFWSSNLFYNQIGEVFAQKTPATIGVEIPVGEVIDQAEDLTQKIIDELNKIESNGKKEITAARELINLTSKNNCSSNNCYSNMRTSWSCCRVRCTPQKSKGGKGKSYLDKIFNKFSFKNIALAGGCSCVANICSCSCTTCQTKLGSRALKVDNACPTSDINSQLNIIKNSSDEIKKSYEELENLIKEKTEQPFKVELGLLSKIFCDTIIGKPFCKTKPEKILELLNETWIFNTENRIWEKGVRKSVEKCNVPYGDWEKVTKGEITWKALVNCSFAQQSQPSPLIDEEYCQRHNLKCYCYDEKQYQERADNFFCYF